MPVQGDHVYTDTDTLPSRILTACTFCQTEIRKSKSTKRGCFQTSRTIKVRKGGNPRTPRPALHTQTHTPRSFSQLMLIADNGCHNLPYRKLGMVKEGTPRPGTLPRSLAASTPKPDFYTHTSQVMTYLVATTTTQSEEKKSREHPRPPHWDRSGGPLRASTRVLGGHKPPPRPRPRPGAAPKEAARALTSSSWCWQKPRRSGNTDRMEKGAPGKGGPSPSCCAAAAAAGPGGPRSM